LRPTFRPDKTISNYTVDCVVPDYLNDLNAMHCAEEMLADDQWVEYRENIRTVVLGPVRYVSQWCKADIHSTAAQRAEAFLRTIGKWEEGK
jgi:hypothetical protein